MTTPQKVYWDSCIWIALLNKEGGRFENITPLFNRAKNKELIIYTSILSLVEVAKTKNYKASDPERDAYDKEGFGGIFFYNFIERIQLDIPVALLARSFVEHNELKPLDAIHLASACHYSCDVIYTYDTKLLKLNGKTSPEGHPLIISEPPPPEEPPLPLQ